MAMFLLDTSALRALPSTLLVAVRDVLGADLALSPISFWELLSHLDEGDFRRSRGNILKCRIPRLLEDPHAGYARSLGIDHHAHPSRFEEPGLIDQLLEGLEGSQSLEAFFRVEVPAGGAVLLAKDSPARARALMAATEAAFVTRLVRLEAEVLSVCPTANAGVLCDAALFRLVISAVFQVVEHVIARDGPQDGLDVRALAAGYVHHALMTARVLDRFARGQGAKYDPNDTEDTYIALHLNMLDSAVLVSADEGMLAGAGGGIRSFHQFTGLHPACRAVSADAFRNEAEAALAERRQTS